MISRAILQSIEENHEIDRNTDLEFLLEYQRAVLLALKENGTLNEMQYRYAEKKLKKESGALCRERKPV